MDLPLGQRQAIVLIDWLGYPAEEAAKILVGSALDPATVKKAVAAAEAITSPAADARGPAHYRTKMAGVMLTRALSRAKTRARG